MIDLYEVWASLPPVVDEVLASLPPVLGRVTVAPMLNGSNVLEWKRLGRWCSAEVEAGGGLYLHWYDPATGEDADQELSSFDRAALEWFIRDGTFAP